MQIALGRSPADEAKTGLSSINFPRLFREFKEHDFARTGSIATKTDQKDSEQTSGDFKPIQSGPKDEVSEVNPDLESQIFLVATDSHHAS
ncbi:hypothetical protein E2562_027670 [Oryza meyeriana var. granulata]|uniref:Uncharacterized protein n=1 Tax=Oryza meyeriana var. granulata TaxID=110450 RepID=A0A6G1EQE5_9ORYZ|nr:hypothetical protein E2562_027670 [Oryza meyeriana var. granulata]